MKEKIIEILNNNFPDKDGWATFDAAADKLVILIDVEVEKRIAEKMVSERLREAKDLIDNLWQTAKYPKK